MMKNSKRKITPIDQHIGRNLREMRESHGMSQKELAAILDVTFQQVQKYEKGKNRLPAAKLFALTRFFNVSCEHFFQGGKIIKSAEIESNRLNSQILHQIQAIKDKNLKQRISQIIDVLAAPS